MDETQTLTVWKIVLKTKVKNVFKSCTGLSPSVRVLYTLGEQSSPKIGAIFAFKTVASAQHFGADLFYSSLVLLKCSATPYPLIDGYNYALPCLDCGTHRKYEYEHFWKNYQTLLYTYAQWNVNYRRINILNPQEHLFGDISYAPEGTILCTTLIPLEVVN